MFYSFRNVGILEETFYLKDNRTPIVEKACSRTLKHLNRTSHVTASRNHWGKFLRKYLISSILATLFFSSSSCILIRFSIEFKLRILRSWPSTFFFSISVSSAIASSHSFFLCKPSPCKLDWNNKISETDRKYVICL